jgi:hypothetical protein
MPGYRPKDLDGGLKYSSRSLDYWFTREVFPHDTSDTTRLRNEIPALQASVMVGVGDKTNAATIQRPAGHTR